MLSADKIQKDDPQNTFHSFCFSHWLKPGFSTKCCYLNQYIPHYRMMNISSARLLLQMNNLTVLYQEGFGVQWYSGPSAFKHSHSLWNSLKYCITSPKRSRIRFRDCSLWKCQGRIWMTVLTVKISSVPISHCNESIYLYYIPTSACR